MDKRKITLSVIGAAVLLLTLVGATYAYFALNNTSSTSAQASIQTGGLILRLDDVDGITSDDKIDPNHLSFNKYFSVTNQSNEDGYAKLMFKDLVNTFVTDALVYELEEVQADKTSYATPRMVITNEVLPKSATASNQTLADGLLIEHGTVSGNTVTPNTKYYKLTVRYNYSDTVNQSEDLNKILTSGFTIEEGQNSVTMIVSFNTNDTNVSTPSNITVTKGSTYGTLPNPTKSGYKAEWYTDSLLTEKVEDTSIVMKSTNHTLYAKWVEKKGIACVDEGGNEITCPATFTMGDRIAIGEGANRQTFRYLRTTSTSSNLSEYRFLAEYNLKRTGTASSSTAIAADALQDPSDGSTKNGVQYGASTDYNQSYVKTYLNNYATTLNTMIGKANAVTVNALSKEEAESLFGCGCPSETSAGTCSRIPTWAKNSNYWLGSAYVTDDVWYYVLSNGYLYGADYSYYNSSFGARAVVNIPASLF